MRGINYFDPDVTRARLLARALAQEAEFEVQEKEEREALESFLPLFLSPIGRRILQGILFPVHPLRCGGAIGASKTARGRRLPLRPSMPHAIDPTRSSGVRAYVPSIGAGSGREKPKSQPPMPTEVVNASYTVFRALKPGPGGEARAVVKSVGTCRTAVRRWRGRGYSARVQALGYGARAYSGASYERKKR